MSLWLMVDISMSILFWLAVSTLPPEKWWSSSDWMKKWSKPLVYDMVLPINLDVNLNHTSSHLDLLRCSSWIMISLASHIFTILHISSCMARPHDPSSERCSYAKAPRPSDALRDALRAWMVAVGMGWGHCTRSLSRASKARNASWTQRLGGNGMRELNGNWVGIEWDLNGNSVGHNLETQVSVVESEVHAKYMLLVDIEP